MRLNYLNQKREDTIPPLLDLLARRPELRDVGIAGYLVDSALNDEGGAMPKFRSYLVFVDLVRELEVMLPPEYALEVHR